MRMVLIDFRHPFFRPIARRIVITVILAVWTGVELLIGSQFWVILFAGLTAYVGWGFFLSGQPDEPDAKSLPSPGEGDSSLPSQDTK